MLVRYFLSSKGFRGLCVFPGSTTPRCLILYKAKGRMKASNQQELITYGSEIYYADSLRGRRLDACTKDSESHVETSRFKCLQLRSFQQAFESRSNKTFDLKRRRATRGVRLTPESVPECLWSKSFRLRERNEFGRLPTRID